MTIAASPVPDARVPAKGFRRGVPRSPRFGDDEDGAASVEMVLWLPVFILILAFILDVTMTMLAHSLMWDVARDTVRQLSLGRMDAVQAVDHARVAAQMSSTTPTVTASDAGPEVWIEITLPIADVTMFNFIGIAGSETISAKAIMMEEPG